MFNKLLIDDYPILVLPKLAELTGLNEAITLQQIHYWLNKSNKVEDGRKWTYGSYEHWQKQFPFWSVSTMKRTFKSLESQNLIITGNYNRAGFDKTKWYSVNYEELNRVVRRFGQNDPTIESNWSDGLGQNEQTNTLDLPKTTTETKNTLATSDEDREIFSEYVESATDLVDKLWVLYPKERRKGKSKTINWLNNKKNKGKLDLSELETGVNNYLAQQRANKTQGKYHMDFERLVTKEYYKDYQESVKSNQNGYVRETTDSGYPF